ncbi:DUF5134 domain-containing protein [Mycobacterium nebraskense]|uniref:DUF5134 domain-containing protein n=1 Tax=Mycobacterium nebraskense TaxID=244292 RepID=UPI0006180BC6|nr:DUF5134 domain-containing protein [Mycobacterium nebraskense]KKC02122.1 hypothetical protein WU83_25795 [Mycobacterium nebraskense]
MIHDLLLRWMVTGLFALTAAECGLAIVIKHHPWTSVVSYGLRFVMAVAMVVMAWPWNARLPTTGSVVFFLLAAVWFVIMAVVAARTTASRVLYGYHGLMMLAMAWMYAIKNGHLLPAGSGTQYHAQPATSMPDVDMAATTTAASSGAPIWSGAVNWLGTITFAAAAVFWTGRYFTDRQHDTARYRSLGNLGQAMMAAGMAILFLATLIRI